MRVVIAEQQYLLRSGLVRLLTDHGIDVAAAVETGPELLTALGTHRPDLTIVDGRLPPDFAEDGVRTALTARTTVPGLPVLVFAERLDRAHARELLADEAGSVGYLRKDRMYDEDAFLEPVRRVAAGGTAIDPDLITRLLAESPRHGPLATLTDRDRQVLELIARGHGEAAIGELLGLPPSAVDRHVAGVFGKLDLPPVPEPHRRVAAVLAYLDHPPDSPAGP